MSRRFLYLSSKTCYWLGVAWFVIAGVVVVAAYLMILIREGWSEVAALLSPFNVWNVIALIVTFAPGFFLHWCARRLLLMAAAKYAETLQTSGLPKG